MDQPRSRFGLSLRFILSSSVIVALATASLSTFFVNYHKTEMRRALEKRAALQADYLARELARLWDPENPGRAGQVIETAMGLEDVAYLQVLDRSGREMARQGAVTPASHPVPSPDRVVVQPAFSSRPGPQGASILEVEYPVPSSEPDGAGGRRLKVLGFLRCGVSEEFLERSVRRAVRTSVLISIVVALISILLIAVIVRRIVEPLLRLAAAAGSLAAGDLSTKVEVQSADEVGDVAGAFNTMVEKLRQSRLELERVWEAQERSKMEHVVESMVDAVVVVGTEQTVLLANRKAREVLGLGSERDVALGSLRVGGQGLAPWVSPVLEGTQELVGAKVVYGRPRQTTVQVAVSPMRGANRELVGAIAVIRDVTREVEMTQQLLQSEKLAAIGQLASGVAHEVNNPLTVISGFAEMLRRQLTDPTQVNLIEKMMQQAERCGEIVRSLSRFSRKSAGRKVPCDLNRILQETANLLLSQYRKVNVAIVLDLAEAPPPVLANDSEVQQVVFNLMNNARDAMPQGGTITLRSDLWEGQVRFLVRDEGRGIAPEHMKDLFTPFFTTKEPGKGTGLGLAVCSSIIHEHGGRITVDSEVGRGTTFFVYLPRAQGSLPPPQPRERRARPVTLSPRRVLVVDDEADILALCRALVGELDCEVVTCGDPARGAEAALAEPFGLWLVDIRMPTMTGPELVERLRREGRDTPALFMTGLLDADPATLVKGDLGRHGLLKKPFDVVQLSQAIRSLLPPPPGVS